MDDHVFGDKTKISDWTEISQYISKHFPDLDSSSPMLKYACVYNVIVQKKIFRQIFDLS